MEIRAAIVNEKDGAIRFEAVNLQEPQANEVRVRIVATGVCHTDLGVRAQHIQTPLPIALGHEGAGVIEQVGPGVTQFAPGDHVVISFSYCGNCANCLQGHPSGCEHFFELNFGGTMLDGTNRLAKEDKHVATLFGQSSLATHAIVHVNNLVRVDKDLDLRLLGPLACGIQTGAGTVLNKLRPNFGEQIAIFGCGGVGLSAVMGAALTGCSHIIAVDVNDDRLALAQELGATHVINGRNVDVVAEIQRLTGGGVHYAVESSGISAIVVQAVHSLRIRGTLAVVGVSGNTTLHIHDDLIPSNRTIVGVVEGSSIPKLFIPKLIEYYNKGRFPFDKLIKTYPVESLNEALDDMKSGQTIKPVITFE
ncbi:NAD(P)-dependent alcohol dehydrogenase [Alicyclobacillus dauci]|uniref:NAD(P)-dependent alcohol dehydrogenase n=1 Tax=Alicyclobacillus dauci TaxID=1475485 RepID=A0ABY6Z4F7_9BACL|nr:NAD(P)-dependent alcohol dehydrogenase [Alicyclobacillus dauci]WAH37552.1 NAD(P)-dependent alcohol dehydrogenase [Alicyclobacillus dauci]